MKPKEAKIIHDRWLDQGQKACPHSLLELEHSDGGYLTGSYFCLFCGSHILHGEDRLVFPPDPQESETLSL